jgi:hypothetical protein
LAGWAAFPLPGAGRSVVAVPAPARGPQNWAGSSSAALAEDGTWVIAYRTRVTAEDHAATVVAVSEDGERLETIVTLDKSRFGAMSMERPAVVRTPDGRWHLYVCSATPGSKHWWIDLLAADEPARWAEADPRTVFRGNDQVAVKDPVVRLGDDGWHAWICCHPLTEPDEEDRMTTAYATSEDGVSWTWHGTALAPRPGRRDARGARLTALLPTGGAAYDGRATKDENWFERTGLARATGVPGRFEQANDAPLTHVRYLDVVALPGGAYRLFYEAPLPDESHELRTELVAQPG